MLFPGLPLVRMTVSGTPGTADFTLNAAVSGFLTVALAGGVTGRTYNYGAEGNYSGGVATKREVGRGVWTSATGVLTRATVLASTNGGAKESFGSDAQVVITPLADDLDWMVTQNSAPVALTYASPITFDWSAGYNFTVTLTGNTSLANPTSGVPGTWHSVEVTQDSNGTRTLDYGNQYKFPGGVKPVVGTGNGAVSRLLIYCRSSSIFEVYAAGMGLA